MTTVTVNTYTHSVTYVSDNIMRVLQDIIYRSGLNPGRLTGDWGIISQGIQTWLGTGHLNKVVLEVFNPSNNELVGRWDIDIVYGASSDDSYWTNTEQIKDSILRAGLNPNNADYKIIAENKLGHPSVEGWVSTNFRNTDGFARHSFGMTISHGGLGAATSGWSRR